jgi:hypothetical protein
MSALEGHVQDYLRLRRALGFKLKPEGRLRLSDLLCVRLGLVGCG